MGSGLVCSNVTSSKPSTPGRDAIDGPQTSGTCIAVRCGSRKCETCKHLAEGNTFTSNVTNSDVI